MLASGCIENQYSQVKEKVVINAHFKHANFRAVGIPPTLIFNFFWCRKQSLKVDGPAE